MNLDEVALRARYYDPAIGRFTQQDTHWNTANMIYGDNPKKINEREDKLGLKTYSYAPQIRAIVQSRNLYIYGLSNPNAYFDESGNVAERPFDVISLVFSFIDVATNPADIWAWLGFAGDLVDLIPFVTGVGEAVKVVSVTTDVIDDVHDAARIIENAGETLDAAGDVARRADFYITPEGVAIPATKEGFHDNLSKMVESNGKYIGTDSNGPIRIWENEIHIDKPDFSGSPNEFHVVPHFHIERRAKGLSGKWFEKYTGPMEMLY